MRNNKVNIEQLFVVIIALLPSIFLFESIRDALYFSLNYQELKDMMAIHYQPQWSFIVTSIVLISICLIFISALSFRRWSYQIIKVALIILLTYSLLDFSREVHHSLSMNGMVLHSDHTGMHEHPMTSDEKWESIYRPVVIRLGIVFPLAVITWVWIKTKIKNVFINRTTANTT